MKSLVPDGDTGVTVDVVRLYVYRLIQELFTCVTGVPVNEVFWMK